MNFEPEKREPDPHLEVAELRRLADSLGDLYGARYDEEPEDVEAYLSGSILALVFKGGLSVGDEWLLSSGADRQLSRFRRQFFEAIDEELATLIADLSGWKVTYSSSGFDPRSRTTYAIFFLGARRPDVAG